MIVVNIVIVVIVHKFHYFHGDASLKTKLRGGITTSLFKVWEK